MRIRRHDLYSVDRTDLEDGADVRERSRCFYYQRGAVAAGRRHQDASRRTTSSALSQSIQSFSKALSLEKVSENRQDGRTGA